MILILKQSACPNRAHCTCVRSSGSMACMHTAADLSLFLIYPPTDARPSSLWHCAPTKGLKSKLTVPLCMGRHAHGSRPKTARLSSHTPPLPAHGCCAQGMLNATATTSSHHKYTARCKCLSGCGAWPRCHGHAHGMRTARHCSLHKPLHKTAVHGGPCNTIQQQRSPQSCKAVAVELAPTCPCAMPCACAHAQPAVLLPLSAAPSCTPA